MMVCVRLALVPDQLLLMLTSSRTLRSGLLRICRRTCCVQAVPDGQSHTRGGGPAALETQWQDAPGADQQTKSPTARDGPPTVGALAARSVSLPTAEEVRRRSGGPLDSLHAGAAAPAATASPYAALFQMAVPGGQSGPDAAHAAGAPLNARHHGADPAAAHGVAAEPGHEQQPAPGPTLGALLKHESAPSDVEGWLPAALADWEAQRPLKTASGRMTSQMREHWRKEIDAARSAKQPLSRRASSRRQSADGSGVSVTGGTQAHAAPVPPSNDPGAVAAAADAARQKIDDMLAAAMGGPSSDKVPQSAEDAGVEVSLPLTPRSRERTVARGSDISFTTAASLACAPGAHVLTASPGSSCSSTCNAV